jgi:hypothetical protein
MAYVEFLESIDAAFPRAMMLAKRYLAAFKPPYDERAPRAVHVIQVRHHGYRKEFVCNVCGARLKDCSRANDRISKADREKLQKHANAHERGFFLPTITCLPDYEGHRLAAPLERNTRLVAACDELHAWPASWSRGTWDTVRKARKEWKPVVVHEPWRAAP